MKTTTFTLAFLITLFCFNATHATVTTVPNILSAPVVLYDEGGNPLEDGDYSAAITIKDTNGNTRYEEEQLLTVINHVAPLIIGQGYAVGSSLSSPAGGLTQDLFDVEGDITVEITVEGQQNAQEIAVLTTQPFAFISQKALGVADGSITSTAIQDGSITADDLENSFLESLQGTTIIMESGQTLTARDVSVASDIGLGNSGATTVHSVLQDLDSALSAVKGLDLVQSLEDVNLSIDNVATAVDTLDSDLDSLESSVSENSTAISSLQNTANTHSSEIASLQSSDDIHSLQISTLQSTETTLSSQISSLNSTLNSHTADTGNPHGITYSQTGAASSSHNHDSDYVNKSGDTMSGDLNMDGNSLTNVGEVDGVDVNVLSSTVSDQDDRITVLEADAITSENEISQSIKPLAYGTATLNSSGSVSTCSGYNIDSSATGQCDFSGTNAASTDYVVTLTPSSNYGCGNTRTGYSGSLQMYSTKSTTYFQINLTCDGWYYGLPTKVDFVVFSNQS